jgi:hypothetical protein
VSRSTHVGNVSTGGELEVIPTKKVCINVSNAEQNEHTGFKSEL